MTALWYDFKRRRRDPRSPVCRNRDDIPDYCRDCIVGRIALGLAVRSIRPNGKMHNHQVKVKRALPAYEEKLQNKYKILLKMENFHQLWVVFDTSRTPGIGPMTVYDVAVRFGAWRRMKPGKIYIHAGTSAGLKALGINPSFWGETIPMDALPAILRNKDPDEVEDFLCTYRLAFERLR